MDREEMERLQPEVYDGANYVAGQTKEHAQLEEASQKDLKAEEIELYNDNIAISALNEDSDRDNKKIESLMVSLEKAEARNDKIRDELLAKVAVEKELENAHEEIRMLEKRLERVTGDLETANKKLWEKSDLEEYVESANKEIRTLWAELDSVKAENKRVKSENVLQKATLAK
ncbi:virulence factor-related M protein-like [Palaemon carinicauda]|uniref:virulence factor-related M protein-like n=1 Tax=Palaemon carinicauda TaxID=392227 RepID=UPI0035B6056A